MKRGKASPAVILLAFAGAMLAGGTAVAAVSPADIFDAADTDRDGTLDRTEFRTFIDKIADVGGKNAIFVRKNKYYDRAFARLDKNRDQKLSKAELGLN